MIAITRVKASVVESVMLWLQKSAQERMSEETFGEVKI